MYDYVAWSWGYELLLYFYKKRIPHAPFNYIILSVLKHAEDPLQTEKVPSRTQIIWRFSGGPGWW